VKLGNLEATKLQGWIGAVGGNISQSYLSHVFKRADKYISFTLYELDRDIQLENPWAHKPGEIDKESIDTFNLMLSTFRFLG